MPGLHMHSLLHYQHSAPDVISDTTDEPTLTLQADLNSIVYSTVHSLFCIFYTFGQMNNDTYLSLQSHEEYF